MIRRRPMPAALAVAVERFRETRARVSHFSSVTVPSQQPVSLSRVPMHRNLSRSLRASLLLGGLWATAAVAQSSGPLHPLDGLTTAEYWAAYDELQQAGHAAPDSFFASVLLREPAKRFVLAWKEGEAVPREADVVMLQNGKTFEARVDLAGHKLISWRE